MGQTLNKKNSNVIKLISDIKQECRKYNVKLKLTDSKFLKISNSLKVGGYFYGGDTNERPVLACAMGGNFEKSLSILIHESSHLDQWKRKTHLWEKADATLMIDEWLQGKELTKKELNKIFKNVIEIELDCEKRSLEKIKKYDIPIDREKYIQKANSYVLFYNYVKKHRKWSIPGNPPYGDKVSKDAPKKWLKSYDKIPKRLEKAYDKFLNII